MIVRNAETHWLLITQPAHARMARRVMEAWPALKGAPRREEILLAIAEHDSGWAETDSAPLVDPESGGIVDFVHAPLETRQAGAPRAMALLTHAPWAAALVAQHGLTAYARRRTDPEWSAYYESLENSRGSLLASCGRSLDELKSDYAYLRLADLISLAFCTGWTDVSRYEHWEVVGKGDKIRVTPAEQRVRIEFEVEAAQMAKVPYKSDAQLREALRTAPRILLRGEVSA